MNHICLPVSTFNAVLEERYELNATFSMAQMDQILNTAINRFGIKVILDQHQPLCHHPG
jgi:hypothetical protein